MAKKTHTQKDGSVWEWEQSKEIEKILKELSKYKNDKPS